MIMRSAHSHHIGIFISIVVICSVVHLHGIERNWSWGKIAHTIIYRFIANCGCCHHPSSLLSYHFVPFNARVHVPLLVCGAQQMRAAAQIKRHNKELIEFYYDWTFVSCSRNGNSGWFCSQFDTILSLTLSLSRMSRMHHTMRQKTNVNGRTYDTIQDIQSFCNKFSESGLPHSHHRQINIKCIFGKIVIARYFLCVCVCHRYRYPVRRGSDEANKMHLIFDRLQRSAVRQRIRLILHDKHVRCIQHFRIRCGSCSRAQVYVNCTFYLLVASITAQ